MDRGNHNPENKAWIPYNGTTNERDVQVGSVFVLGCKMSQYQILSSLPFTSPMDSNEGSIEID